jgi:endonuclease YncB( thermonuclease family)/predicted flap endonuclease-1-like 5' DNA nuclease
VHNRRPIFSSALLASLYLLSLGNFVRAEGVWRTYQNCQLLRNEANDGDSFHVRAAGREYIFRLYFVDTPETDASFPGRVAEQGKYFHLSRTQTLRAGQVAEHFTLERLARPFTVETCKEDARGRSRLPRYFACVEIEGKDLAEELVANGLARIYGAPGHAPGRPTPAAEKRELRQLERNAKGQRLGAWGMSEGGLSGRIGATANAGSNSFDAFFHRDRTAMPALKVVSSPAADREKIGPDTKLDINHATRETLLALPGVGPVLSARIMAARPFKSADELRRVKGIGAKRYQQLRPCFE